MKRLVLLFVIALGVTPALCMDPDPKTQDVEAMAVDSSQVQLSQVADSNGICHWTKVGEIPLAAVLCDLLDNNDRTSFARSCRDFRSIANLQRRNFITQIFLGQSSYGRGSQTTVGAKELYWRDALEAHLTRDLNGDWLPNRRISQIHWLEPLSLRKSGRNPGNDESAAQSQRVMSEKDYLKENLSFIASYFPKLQGPVTIAKDPDDGFGRFDVSQSMKYDGGINLMCSEEMLEDCIEFSFRRHQADLQLVGADSAFLSAAHASHPAIQALILTKPKHGSPEAAQVLSAFSHLRSLTIIYGEGLADWIPQDLRSLRSLTLFTSHSRSNEKLATLFQPNFISKILSLINLEEIELYYSVGESPGGTADLSGLGGLSHLKKLALSTQNPIAGLDHLQQIEELKVRGDSLKTDSVLNQMGKLKKLRKLDLDSFSSDFILKLLPQLPDLEELTFDLGWLAYNREFKQLLKKPFPTLKTRCKYQGEWL